MHPIAVRLAVLLGVWLGVLMGAYPAAAQDDALSLRTAIDAELTVRGTPALTRDIESIDRVYRARSDRPVWIDAGGPTARGRAVLDAMATASQDGLDPGRYAVTVPPPRPLAADVAARLELALSAAIIRYARDLRSGRVRPQTFDPNQHVLPPAVDGEAVLAGAMDAPNPGSFLATLRPASPMYVGLRATLAAYRSIEGAGGWPSLPAGTTLVAGDDDPRAAVLRRRLHATGDYAGSNLKSSRFDGELAAAVQRFQQRHGLAADASVGPATAAALNVPVAERIRQILVNMERLRWMPDTLGNPHVLVNMASFELDVMRDEKSTLNMRVVVGKPVRSTPVFSDQIRVIEFNPYWNVPRSIATQDLLPKARRNPGYFVDENIRVFTRGDDSLVEVSPRAIDWNAYSTNHFPFRLRQDPGPKNALGRIKFLFPNEFDVYLHDTPSRGLFSRNVRTFSSGCIRVEKPAELAVELLVPESAWDKERIEKIISRNKRQSIQLKQPIPIHLTYITAWIDGSGAVHFRGDVYGRDQLLAAAVFG